MKSKELLFELIHSLTKSEKRYFKVFTAIHKQQNNYIKLFDAILEQKEYDEDLLIEKFKEEDFVRQFSVAKNYLMNLILKSLSKFHQKARASIELNELLTEIEILYLKGLYVLANKKIKETRKLAEKYDLTIYLIIVDHWESKIRTKFSSTKSNRNIKNEGFELVKSYNQEKEMNILGERMKEIMEESSSAVKKSNFSIQHILSHKLMQLKEDEIKNFYIKAEYFEIHQHIGLMLKDGTGYAYQEKLLKLLEKNPHQINEDPLFYIQTLRNFVFGNNKREFKNILKYLNQLDQLKLKFKFEKERNFVLETTYALKLAYFFSTKDKKELGLTLEEMKEWYINQNTPWSIKKKMIIEYNLACDYFIIKNYKESLKWCHSSLFIPETKTNEHHDIVISVLIIQVLIYFKLTHYELALKRSNQIISIATKNEYNTTNMLIFNLLKHLAIIEDATNLIEQLKLIIKGKPEKNIDFDYDILTYLIEWKDY